MYPDVEYILSNYLSADTELDWNDAVVLIQDHMKANIELASRYRNQLRIALEDNTYSWKDTFEKYNVYDADDESDAHNFARDALWNAILDAGQQ